MTDDPTTREWFFARSRDCSVVPMWLEVPADWWTPVGVFHQLTAGEPHAFLLESVEGGERVGRYSFVGRRPFRIATVADGHLTWDDHTPESTDPVGSLRDWFATNRMPPLDGLPRF